jgi:hypothetical protein
MKFRSNTYGEYFHPLQIDHPLIKKIPSLLTGDYYYRFTVKNPFKQTVKVLITVSDGDSPVTEHVLEFTDLIKDKEIVISKSTERFAQPIEITFALKAGKNILITLPVSPIMVPELKTEDKDYESIAYKIQSAFDDKFSQLHQSAEQAFSKQMQMEIFKDCITTAEAERQLDFIVFNKLFAPDGSKGFTKFKRALYRKFLRAIYRRLTKNTIRKQYFAKLYRNYINSSVISDNLEKANL